MRDSGTERSAEDAVAALPPDRLEAVVATITTTMLRAPMATGPGDASEASETAAGEAGEVAVGEAAPAGGVVGAVGGRLPRNDRWAYLEFFGAMIVVTALTLGEIRVGLIGGALVGLRVVMRLIDRHVTFSFGAAFVGYRGDPRWPQGVQEDDDVHWNWQRRTASVPRQIPVPRALGGGNGFARR